MKKIIITLMVLGSMAMASDGAALYKKCVACHGANGEKVALGKSLVINKMTKDDLASALNGYKDGSYGKSMKALMKGQVAKLDSSDIDALAEYIAGMK